MKKDNIVDPTFPRNYSYRPLPDFLEVRDSVIEGTGLFAKDDIPSDTVLGISHINIYCSELIYDESFMTLVNETYPGGLIRTPLAGFCNHSVDSNIKMENRGECGWVFTTTRDIRNGEEILINYNGTPCLDEDKCGENG